MSACHLGFDFVSDTGRIRTRIVTMRRLPRIRQVWMTGEQVTGMFLPGCCPLAYAPASTNVYLLAYARLRLSHKINISPAWKIEADR